MITTKLGETFDLLEFKYTEPEPAAHSEDDVDYKERNEKLLHLIKKKENHQPVIKQCTTRFSLNYSIIFDS